MVSLPKRNIFMVISGVLLIAVIVLSLQLQKNREDFSKSESRIEQTSNILSGESAVEGYSCGVLDKKIASEFIGFSLAKKFSQGPENFDSITGVSWQDSCRYEDPADSTKYVEIYINNYQSREQTITEYDKFFQLVNENKEYPAGSYGEELVYDSGVFYLRQNQRVIRVAASNGNPSQAEEIALSVFKILMTKI